MHNRARRWVTVMALALGAASTALAAGAATSTPLYVKARNTRLMASASPTADVVAVLQPGQKVMWIGPDEKNKQWHHVEVVGGKKGLIFQSNLAKQPPSLELVAKDGARTVDTKALASSGAAIRGLADGATQYGQQKGKQDVGFQQAVTDVKKLEKLAEAITLTDLAAHADQAHLFPVVGPQTAVSPRSKR